MLTGSDPAARSLLAAAEVLRSQTDADYGRDAMRWPEVEQAVLAVSCLA
jgi:hypothetical protein